MQLDGFWGALQRFFGKADACFKHAGGRIEDPQATAGVHSTETEKEWIGRTPLGFPEVFLFFFFFSKQCSSLG